MKVIMLSDKIDLVDINLADFISTLEFANEHKVVALGCNYYFIYDDGIALKKEHNMLASLLIRISRGSDASYRGDCIIVKTASESWDYDGTGLVDIEQKDYDRLLEIIDEYKRSTEST